MILFGSGTLIAKPLTGVGNSGPNPTPMALGVLQDCQVEISREIKQLYGQNQFPVAIAPAKHKMTAKAKFAQIFGKQWMDLVAGQTTAASYKAASILQASTIPATPYQLLPGPVDATHYPVPGSGTYLEDQGVYFAATGIPLVKVASGPTTGQYSVNEATGQYTFAAADTTLGVLLNYIYSNATGGVSMTFANQLMGFGPVFEANLVVQYSGQSALLRIFNCVCAKTTFPTKLDDFVIDDFEFEAFANAAGNVFEINLTQ